MEYKVIKEIRGTIIEITNHDGKEGVVMQPDDPNLKTIRESYRGRDYSNFNVGQRGVLAEIVMCNPSNDAEMKKYTELRKRQFHRCRLMFDEKVYDNFINNAEKTVIDDEHRVFVSKRLATILDIEKHFLDCCKCPDIVTDYDYEAYAEREKSKGR